MRYVLDASALLAMLQGESGGEWVADRLDESVLSAVNLVEVGTRLLDLGLDPFNARSVIERLRIPVVGFDSDLAERAILLRRASRQHGLSLGGRACIALALREGAAAVTSDQAWATLNVGCEIVMIR